VFINSLIDVDPVQGESGRSENGAGGPKRLELNLYENIPHLIAPVVTDPRSHRTCCVCYARNGKPLEATGAARRAKHRPVQPHVQEGTSPSLFDSLEETEHKPLPYLIIVIDELADLMMVDTKQRGRIDHQTGANGARCGIHLNPRDAKALRGRDHWID